MKLSFTRNAGLLAAFLSVVNVASAQQATPAWQRAERLGVASAGVRASATDAAGNTYIVGGFLGTAQFGSYTFSSAGSTYGDGYLLKLNAQGTVLWARQITGSREEIVAAVTVDAAGQVTIAGTLQQTASFGDAISLGGATISSPDLFVARYDASTGAVIWARSFGGSTENVDAFVGSGVAVDAAGNSYVAGCLLGSAMVGGSALRNTAPRLAPVLLKLDAAGNGTWARQGQLAATGAIGPGGAAAISVDTRGNVALCGTFTGSLNWGGTTLQTVDNQAEVFVTRFDAAGAQMWARQSSNSRNARPNALAQDAAGNTYVTGEYTGPTAFGVLVLAPASQSDGYLIKYDADGTAQWARSIGSSNGTSSALTLSAAGDIYLTGSFTGPVTLAPGITLAGYGSSDVLVACYTAQGGVRWAQQAGSAGPDWGTTIGVDAAERVYVSGQCASLAQFPPVALSGLGVPFVAQLAAQPLATAAGRSFKLLTFSPNPATEVVHFAALPSGTQVVVLDALGRTVRSSTVQQQAANMQVSVRGLAPGAYLLRATEPTGRQYGGRLLVQ